MTVLPIKTPVVHVNDNLFEIIDAALPVLEERSVVVVTSKIVALCEGSVVEKRTGTSDEKRKLVARESEAYLDRHSAKYEFMISIKHGILAVNAGIDESNADGTYVLLPTSPYQSAIEIWRYLRQKHAIRSLGVIITDSRTMPLKWGTMGTYLSHCGFDALNNRIGEKDLFGHEMKMTQVNIAEGLAAAAVVEMGEVAESQPIAIITNCSAIHFTDHEITKEEIDALTISPEDDVYAPLLKGVQWKTVHSEKKEK